MRFSSSLQRGLVPSCLFAVSLCASTQAAEAPQARLFGSYPAKSNPFALLAGWDGYLYGAFGEYGTTGGAIFRVTPNGNFQTLHLFPRQMTQPTPNLGGSSPDANFTIGEDGCLYGITRSGGAWGHGVLYRVSPAGAYSVALDLPTDFARFALIEGEGHQLYVFDGRGGIYRLGVNGTTRIGGDFVGDALQVTDLSHPDYFSFYLYESTDDGFLTSLTLNSFNPATGVISAGPVTLTPGAGYSSTISGAQPGTAIGDILALNLRNFTDSGETGRVVAIKDGEVRILGTFGIGQNMAPPMARFLTATNDGIVYYLTGSSTTPWGQGSTVIALNPDGSHHVVCGFGGESCAAFVDGPRGNRQSSYYSMTPSDTVYLPRTATLAYSADWMSPAKAADHRVLRGKRNQGTFFQITPDGSALDSQPLAPTFTTSLGKKDKLEVPFRPAVRDPEGDLFGEGGASMLYNEGYGQLTTDVKGRRLSFLYTTFLLPDPPRGSNIGFYTVFSSGPYFGTSTGSILVRGDVAGKYVDVAQRVGKSLEKRLTFTLQPNGRFTALLPAHDEDGTDLAGVPVSGMLDYHDQGSAAAKVPGMKNAYVSVTFSIQGDELNYLIRRTGDTPLSGSAVLGD